MTESERCELVLNAVFNWEPVEFFQKLCDMITLQFFQDEPCGVVVHTKQAADSDMDRPPSSAGQTQDGVVYQQEE